MRGDFKQPVRLAEAMRTDDALFTAYMIRVSTQLSVCLKREPPERGRLQSTIDRLDDSVCTPPHVRQSILGTLANHGIAIGYVLWSVKDTDAGPTVAFELTEWPLEHVRYLQSDSSLVTSTLGGLQVPITHGDGRWIVFRKFGLLPWTQDAAILPGALLWAAHASGIADWAGASAAHGSPKLVGELPQGVRLEGDGGGLSPVASAFISMMQGLVSGESSAAIRPFGSKTDLLISESTAWQVFEKLTTNRESAAMRVYNGTDALLGSRGGAPGVDISALFAVASTRIQGDFEALERGYREGLDEPWLEMHGLDLPYDEGWLRYETPDPDAAAKSLQESDAIVRMGGAITALKTAGIEVTQSVIDALRETLGVSTPCNLAPKPDPVTAPPPPADPNATPAKDPVAPPPAEPPPA